MHLCCISYHDCNLFQTLLRELQKCNDKYNILIMHIIFNIGIGFMIVKRQTWLNNTKRYRAHMYIHIYNSMCIYIYIHILYHMHALNCNERVRGTWLKRHFFYMLSGSRALSPEP